MSSQDDKKDAAADGKPQDGKPQDDKPQDDKSQDGEHSKQQGKDEKEDGQKDKSQDDKAAGGDGAAERKDAKQSKSDDKPEAPPSSGGADATEDKSLTRSPRQAAASDIDAGADAKKSAGGQAGGEVQKPKKKKQQQTQKGKKGGGSNMPSLRLDLNLEIDIESVSILHSDITTTRCRDNGAKRRLTRRQQAQGARPRRRHALTSHLTLPGAAVYDASSETTHSILTSSIRSTHHSHA